MCEEFNGVADFCSTWILQAWDLIERRRGKDLGLVLEY
jgi:hypothetical protein